MGLSVPLRDDPDIPDEEQLYRGILPYHIKEGGIVSSGTFITRPDPNVSVDRSSLSTAQDSLLRLPKSEALAQLGAGSVRKVTSGVASAPTEANPAHALIIRNPLLSRGDWKRAAKRLAAACVWAVPPGTGRAWHPSPIGYNCT